MKSFRLNNFLRINYIGIDVGIKDFAVHSTGEKIENPKYLKSSLKDLKSFRKSIKETERFKNREKQNRDLQSYMKESQIRETIPAQTLFRLVSENQQLHWKL